MKPRRFAIEMLARVKKGFPELHKKYISGRREAFINENTPPVLEDCGEILGRINKDMRLIWSLSQMFYRNAREISGDKDRNMLTAIEHIKLSASYGMGDLCVLGLAIAIWDRFDNKVNKKTHSIQIANDWAVVAVPLGVVGGGNFLDVVLDAASSMSHINVINNLVATKFAEIAKVPI